MSYQNRRVSQKLRQTFALGTVCRNCGKDCGPAIEYHHAVPLEHGGNDVPGNIIPLCRKCHAMCTHGHEHKKAEHTGRKRRVYDAIFLDYIYRKYINKELSEKEARKALGTGSKIKEMAHFKDWAEANSIDTSRTYGQSGRWYK